MSSERKPGEVSRPSSCWRRAGGTGYRRNELNEEEWAGLEKKNGSSISFRVPTFQTASLRPQGRMLRA